MQTRNLLKVDYHYDSDTGMAEVGEIDFGICGTLEDYIKTYGYKGVQDILATLGHLAYVVKKTFYEVHKPDADKPKVDKKDVGGEV